MITQQKDLTDLRLEFDLMLRGFVASCEGGIPPEEQGTRLLCFWNDLDQEISNVQSNGKKED